MRHLFLLALCCGCGEKGNGSGSDTGPSTRAFAFCATPDPTYADCLTEISVSYDGAPEEPFKEHRYDSCGRLTSDLDLAPTGALSLYTYGALGRLVSVDVDIKPVDGIPETTTTVSYDARGRTTALEITDVSTGRRICSSTLAYNDADPHPDSGTDDCAPLHSWIASNDPTAPTIAFHRETDQGADGTVDQFEDYVWDPATDTETYTNVGGGPSKTGLLEWAGHHLAEREQYWNQAGELRELVERQFDGQGRLLSVHSLHVGQFDFELRYAWTCPAAP